MVEFNGYDVEAVGWAWIAWCALEGDGSLEALAKATNDLQHRLSSRDEKAVADARLLMIALSEMLDPNGTSEYRIDIRRRKRGKPINRHERAMRGHRAAGIVRSLEKDGWKIEAAIQRAIEETGLSRAEVFAWHSRDKRRLEAKGDNNQD